ncbi:MAG: helix-turn-helix domain-containing protein [Myxococcales bacterium]|nr:helix-turn-helix domain-containing protein [Myxococcales bacterium]
MKGKLGVRIAAYRKRRAMSQRDLAKAMGRSVSWVSQVERGVQPVERISILNALAQILGVEVAALHQDADPPNAVPNSSPRPDNLGALRSWLSGHPALDLVLTKEPKVRITSKRLGELSQQVDLAWKSAHDNELTSLSTTLINCLPYLEQAIRGCSAENEGQLYALTSRAYFAAATSFARLNEPDAAWVAADRGISAAEHSHQPLEVAAGHFRLSHVFIQLRQFSQAEHVCDNALSALERHPDVVLNRPPALSLLGALYLARARIHAHVDNRSGAKRDLAKAEKVAHQIGDDRNDYNIEFGTTNVQLHQIAIALELGDAGEALEVAKSVEPASLSNERRARFLIDLAHANTIRKHYSEATSNLLEAERLAPEYVLDQPGTHKLIGLLVNLTNPTKGVALYGLAKRSGFPMP